MLPLMIGISISAIDCSGGMLAIAQRNAVKRSLSAIFCRWTYSGFLFQDAFFDTVFASFVFCSEPDPLQGLLELHRVCKPGGRLLLLAHMRPGSKILGWLFDAANPVTVRLTGANVNRRRLKR